MSQFPSSLSPSIIVAPLTANASGNCLRSPPCHQREFGITVTIKPHQVEGVSWLMYKYLLGVDVLLVVLCLLSVTDCWV
ncbi:hypothetical protein BRARA_I01563 [Brassica rapa]|uniref:Uncharacterized protein n=1 Tax=Brassica campestris TaxID=3711 RepID=A0A397Y4L0_BRACM|nr:hypothetical protein BRARA_I01563 [Brassica rapa]